MAREHALIVPPWEPAWEPEEMARLEQRLGRARARQRLAMELRYERKLFREGLNFSHPGNWYAKHSVIAAALKLAGLYGRGRRNSERVRLRHNSFSLPELPPQFEGFTILHVSDLHVEMNPGATRRVLELVRGARVDLCALTGDYRGEAFGPFDTAMEAMARLRAAIAGPMVGLLGNHDTVRMVPGLEQMGIRMLVNESLAIERGGERIYLAGIDDAHYFRAHDIEEAASHIPAGEFSILLSHTPEVFRQAADAGFRLMLSGHTHGGQLCLPGSIPVLLDAAALPRRMGAGSWKYRTMAGYTSAGAGSSVVPVRFNCPPEITLHQLHRAAPPAWP
jgi:uncharacterized protein